MMGILFAVNMSCCKKETLNAAPAGVNRKPVSIITQTDRGEIVSEEKFTCEKKSVGEIYFYRICPERFYAYHSGQ